MGRLFSETKRGDEVTVPGNVFVVEVPQQTTPATDEFQEPPATGMVVLVSLEVIKQLLDALGEHGHLNFDGTCVFLMALMLLDNGNASLSVQASCISAHARRPSLALCALIHSSFTLFSQSLKVYHHRYQGCTTRGPGIGPQG